VDGLAQHWLGAGKLSISFPLKQGESFTFALRRKRAEISMISIFRGPITISK